MSLAVGRSSENPDRVAEKVAEGAAQDLDPSLVKIGVWALVALVAMVFGGVLFADFILIDDAEHVLGNGHVVSQSLAGLIRIWSEPYFGLYIPVTYSAWWLTAAFTVPVFGSMNASVFHALNLLLHALNAVLVYRLLVRVPQPPTAFSALAGALVFALHPTQVESVAWVSELRGVLSVSLCLLALHQALASDDQSLRARSTQWASGLFALAMLAKPSAAVLPLLLWVLNRWAWKKPWRAASMLPLLWAVLAAGTMLVTRRLQPEQGLDFVTPVAQRPLIALDALGFYLSKLLLPWKLGMDYGRAPEVVLRNANIIATSTLVGLLVVVNVLWARKKPWVACASSLFVACLLPVLGLVPFMFQSYSTVADRYLYLAHLGSAWAVAFGVTELGKRIPARAVHWAMALVLAAFAVKSHLQSRAWRDTESLARHSLTVNPNSLWMQQALAKQLAKSGRNEEARALCTRVAAAAKAELRRGAGPHRRDSYVLALKCIGDTILAEGDQKQAAVHFATILQEPEVARATPETLAMVHTDLGTTLFQLGMEREGVDHLQRAVALSDTAEVAIRNLGRILLNQGQSQAAALVLKRVLEINPYDEATRKTLLEIESAR
jgi:hypothetical protein